jgi:ligand-binding sensor domain-containing protein/two-component sensor histidine kinase
VKTIAGKIWPFASRTILFWVTCVCAFRGHAQHPVFYTIDADKGLPSNEVYQLVQDNFGYVWIGCDAGLYRYDGFTFKGYRNSGQNSRSVSSLQVDRQNRVWCRNFAGQILRVEGDSLRLVVDVSNDSIANNQYTLDRHGNAWFFKNRYLVQVNQNGQEIRRVEVPNHGMSATPQYIYWFNNQIFISLRNSYLYTYNDVADEFTQLSVNHADFKLRLHSFFAWNDTLRVLSVNNATRSFLVSNVVQNNVFPVHEYFSTQQNSRVHELTPDNSGNLWVCTTDGAFPFSTRFKYLDEHSGYFRSFKVSYVMKDREGLYWISTLQHGLLVCPSLAIRGWNTSNSALKEDNLTAVSAFANQVVVGSYTGKISMIQPETKHVRYFDDGTPTLNTKKIVPATNAVMIAHGPLTEINVRDQVIHYAPHNIRDFVVVGDSIYYVYSDNVGVASISSLRNSKPTRLRLLRSGGGRTVAYVAAEKAFYFALNDGLFKYENGRWQEVFNHAKSIHAMAFAVSENAVWAATLAMGVLKIERGKVVKMVDLSGGRQDKEVKCITANDKYVWASSQRDLYRIAKETNEVAKFGLAIGFNPADINSIEQLNGDVYFATNKGLVQMPANLPWRNNIRPGMRITSASHGGAALSLATPITLPYFNADFKICFSSTAFRSRGEYVYEYRLVGLSSNWSTSPAALAYTIYSSLPPGDYVFEVRPVNETGQRGETKKLSFSVAPPLWQTWWFYLVVTVVSIGLVALVYTLRIRFLRTQASIANKLTASQLTALKAQMNPHFMYNALNSIQDLVMNGDVKNSNLYLSKFSSLMRKVLDASGADSITLQEEIDILSLYLELEKLRFGDDFQYEISTDPELLTDRVTLPSMILQPFVENSVKHGLLHKKGHKKILIVFKKHAMLTCIISDNGVGRKRSTEIKNRRAEKHNSFSTQATEKRIELLTHFENKKIEMQTVDLEEEGQARGTQVIIRIPLSSW